MDFTILDSSQRAQWQKFVNLLNDLNRRFYKSRFDLWWIQQTIDFYKDKTEALPPSFQFADISSWMSISQQWMTGVQALNNAYALSQAGNAYLAPSASVENDLDLVVEQGSVPQEVINNAIYTRSMLPNAPELGLAPLIPLLIKGAIVVGTIIVVSGIVESISDAIVKHKRIDLNIEKIKANLVDDMKSAGPEVFKQFTSLEKAKLKPAEKGFFANLAGGAGGALGVGVLAVVLFMLWKGFQGRK